MTDEKKAPWFKFWMRNKNNFDAMTDEQTGKTLKALLNYYDTGEEPQNLDPWENATFNNMRQELDECAKWCCTIKVDIENSKSQYIEKDKQEATKDGSESTKI